MNYAQERENNSMATSRAAAKVTVQTIVCCFIAVMFFLSQGTSVWASDHVKLYVVAAACRGGDGSVHAPFARITDAVNTARVIWQADNNAKIEIRVDPGTYIGRHSNTNPDFENFPITLDIPNLKLVGSTSMLIDDDGLPTGVFEPGRESVLKADPPLGANQSLLIIAPTDWLLTGQGVEVSNSSSMLGIRQDRRR